MTDERNEFLETFGEPISTYTDKDAVEDGDLVAINQKDRVTRAVWNFLVEHAPKNHKPPAGWPVDLFGFFRAKTQDDKAKAMAEGVISTNRQQAERVYNENIGGGIFTLNPALGADGTITRLEDQETTHKMWLIPNELGGISLIFPSDY